MYTPLDEDPESLLELLGLPHLSVLICGSFSINIGDALPQMSTSSSTGSAPEHTKRSISNNCNDALKVKPIENLKGYMTKYLCRDLWTSD